MDNIIEKAGYWILFPSSVEEINYAKLKGLTPYRLELSTAAMLRLENQQLWTWVAMQETHFAAATTS